MTHDHAATLDLLTRLAQALRLWAITLVGWLAAATGSRDLRLLWREELRALRRETRELLCLRVGLAVSMGRCVVRRRRKLALWRGDLVFGGRRRQQRFVLGRLRLRTLDELRAVLDDVDAAVARACARFVAGFGRLMYRHARAGSDAAPVSAPVAPRFADSS